MDSYSLKRERERERERESGGTKRYGLLVCVKFALYIIYKLIY